MTMLFRRFGPSLILTLLAGFAVGCSTPTGIVSGTITVNGKPAPKGSIFFVSEAGNKDSFKAEILDGKYQTTEIPAGPTKIYILPAFGQGAQGGETQGNDLLPPAPTGSKKEVVIPDKYGNPETSGLTHEVKAGPNTYDQDLKP